jgi:hypothetical protein
LEETDVRAIRVSVSAAALVFAAGLSAACGGSTAPAPAPAEKIQPTTVGEMSPEEAGGMRAEDSSMKEEAAPASPYGGTPVKLGTAAQLEFVQDPSSGTLTAYILDAAGTKVTRIPANTITVEVTPAGGTATTVTLNSTANGLTGDTVGSSSQFGGTHPALKGVTVFTGIVKNAVIGGQTFTDIAFSYPHHG